MTTWPSISIRLRRTSATNGWLALSGRLCVTQNPRYLFQRLQTFWPRRKAPGFLTVRLELRRQLCGMLAYLVARAHHEPAGAASLQSMKWLSTRIRIASLLVSNRVRVASQTLQLGSSFCNRRLGVCWACWVFSAAPLNALDDRRISIHSSAETHPDRSPACPTSGRPRTE